MLNLKLKCLDIKLFLISLGLFIYTLSMPAAYLNPEEILAKMSLRQKIGQVFVVAAASNFEQPTEQLASVMQKCPYDMSEKHVGDMVKNYGVGGVVFLFKSDPFTQVEFAKKYQALAQTPLLFAQDSEWGLSMRLDMKPEQVVRYPRNLTLGAIADPEIVYEIGHEIGKDCAAIGVHMNLAPVVDVNNNRHNPVIHDRSFGDDPKRVALLASSYTKGLQAAGILACAKHFPGHGDTATDSHLSLPMIKYGRERFNQIELVPFKKLIAEGVDGIMLAHLAVPSLDNSGTPTSLSPTVVSDLLRTELGFEGLIVTDGLGMGAVTANYAPGELELAAFLAGNDILLCPLDVPNAINQIEQAILAGKITEQELDKRVLKILRAKEHVYQNQARVITNQAELAKFLVRPQAQELQEKAYRAAITLVPSAQKLVFDQSSFASSCVIQVGNLTQDHFSKICKNLNKPVLKTQADLHETSLHALLAQTQDASRVIIAISELHKFANRDFGIAPNTRELINSLVLANKEVVLVLFGTPYAANLFKDLPVKIIVAYEDVPATQTAVIDVLRGDLEPTGVMPVSID